MISQIMKVAANTTGRGYEMHIVTEKGGFETISRLPSFYLLFIQPAKELWGGHRLIFRPATLPFWSAFFLICSVLLLFLVNWDSLWLDSFPKHSGSCLSQWGQKQQQQQLGFEGLPDSDVCTSTQSLLDIIICQKLQVKESWSYVETQTLGNTVILVRRTALANKIHSVG